jgi:hypothetical protein
MVTGFGAPSFNVLHDAPIEKVEPSIEQFVVLETLSIIPINPILSPPPPLLFVNDPPLILPLYEFRSSRMEVTLNVPLVISKRCGLEEEGVPSASKVSVASLSKQPSLSLRAGSLVRKIRGVV